jgi:hypothetical protein
MRERNRGDLDRPERSAHTTAEPSGVANLAFRRFALVLAANRQNCIHLKQSRDALRTSNVRNRAGSTRRQSNKVIQAACLLLAGNCAATTSYTRAMAAGSNRSSK